MNTPHLRPLSAGEHEAFRLARLVAAEKMPYFMAALFAAPPVAAEGLGTFAVDAKWRLYMDPTLLVGSDAWPTATAGAVLLHEVGHLIRDHAGRATDLSQPLIHERWNLAADAEINDDLIDAGIGLPEWVVTPTALGLDDGGLAEDYYRALVPPGIVPIRRFDPGENEGGCGSGAGCAPFGGELSDDATLGESAQPVSTAEGDMVRRRVARDVQDHAASKGRGTVSAGLERWAADTLAEPVVPWARVLRAVVRHCVARFAGRTDYTYSRPSRRRVPGIITPAMRGPRVGVAVVIDTSGSMSPEDLAAALSEIGGVLKASGVDRDQIRVLSCDAHTATARRVRSLDSVELVGGGGTDMRVGIAAANALRPAPHVVIVLSDGYTPWPVEPTRTALICAVIRPDEPTDTPPWATTVHISPAA